MDIFEIPLHDCKPSEIVKFDSIEYVPVPEIEELGESISVKDNAIDGKIVETILIDNRGSNYRQSLLPSHCNYLGVMALE